MEVWKEGLNGAISAKLGSTYSASTWMCSARISLILFGKDFL